MKVVIAPDSFKGSATSAEAGAAMAAGVHEALPGTITEVFPMADGGEGTLNALATSAHLELREVPTTDALGRPTVARYAMTTTGRAIVELAQASGLAQLRATELQPLHATTLGTGRVIAAALAAGAREILLCLGGSATTDGGAGILVALGARLRDEHGRETRPGDEPARGLPVIARVATLDLSALDPRALRARWQLACDVTNPLTGPTGAAAVFAPQKGASSDDVQRLDAALSHWTRVLRDHGLPCDEHQPGLGAAGGTPAALVAVFGAKLTPGAKLVMHATGLDHALADADLLLTGEGRLDASSLGGKVVGTLADAARQAGVPVAVVAGQVALSPERLRAAGIVAAQALTDPALPEAGSGIALRVMSPAEPSTGQTAQSAVDVDPGFLARLMADPTPAITHATAEILAEWSRPAHHD